MSSNSEESKREYLSDMIGLYASERAGHEDEDLVCESCSGDLSLDAFFLDFIVFFSEKRKR